MKKVNSLAHQVQMAQRTFNSWSDSRKSTLRLEGCDVFLGRATADQKSSQRDIPHKDKKHTLA
ncbi:hypothetical protein FGKAn22_01300 [Ferrigenium kumadai]|uniref:Uncharacterized protein n=1 Tax=Ferrigenium kumadai TaxID=1682490 RepID=A0AAN1SXI5_9PROT|nr:hypothetical protein [Ferrigenium kumadai]BBI98437.1 hypothetical protein FGKAn22_01300 [Ferrigenium kumadai]